MEAGITDHVWTIEEMVAAGSVAQTAVFAVCGSSLDSLSRTRGQTPFLEICGFCYRRTADPKDGGPRYPNRFALSNPSS
jgi:hypothetical protein